MKKVKVFDSQLGTERVMGEKFAKILGGLKPQRYRTRDMIMERAEEVKAKKELPVLDDEVELDSAGEEWNETLHVASKVKNVDGTWRKRPGAAKAAHE